MYYRLPKWAQKVIVPDGDFCHLNKYFYKMISGTTELKKLKSGFLLKEMLERFKKKALSTLSPDRVLYFYSSHDTTLAPMLNSLGLFEVKFSIAFERLATKVYLIFI